MLLFVASGRNVLRANPRCSYEEDLITLLEEELNQLIEWGFHCLLIPNPERGMRHQASTAKLYVCVCWVHRWNPWNLPGGHKSPHSLEPSPIILLLLARWLSVLEFIIGLCDLLVTSLRLLDRLTTWLSCQLSKPPAASENQVDCQ